jgi:integrase
VRGWVENRYKKSWTLIVDLGEDPVTGKRDRRAKSIPKAQYPLKSDAKDELRRWQNEIEAGISARFSNITVSEYLAQWERDYVEPRLAPSTTYGYKSIIKNHVNPYIGRFKLDALRPKHIQSLYTLLSDKGLAPRMVQLTRAVLREALRHAVEWEVIGRNPADATHAPVPKRKKVQWLLAKEAQALLEYFAAHNPRDYPFVKLALATGMRRGEILALKWSDVDWAKGHEALAVDETLVKVGKDILFTPPKTEKSRRTVTIDEGTVAFLKAYRKVWAERKLAAGPAWQGYDLILPNEDGSPQDPVLLTNRFKYHVEPFGKPGFRVHDLRHTHATLLLLAGVHPKVVQERLGHATIAITLDIYSHVIPSMQEDAAKKMGEIIPSRDDNGFVHGLGKK